MLSTTQAAQTTQQDSAPLESSVQGNLAQTKRQIIVKFKPVAGFSSVLTESEANNKSKALPSTVQFPVQFPLQLPIPIAGLEVSRSMRFSNLPVNARTAPSASAVDPSGASNGLEIAVINITDANLSVDQAIEKLISSGQVEYAEPDYALSVNSSFPNDTQFSTLYGLHNTGQSGGVNDADIDAPEAWDITTGDPNIVIAVIDTGVQYTHPDLAANMWVNPGEIAGNGIDDDGNGYIDDIYGIDTVNNDSDPFDDNNHGTHVAGILGAVGNNNQGVAGVNWNTRIMALKYLNSSGNGVTSDAIELLTYLYNMKVNHGINIRLSNNSWGGGDFSQALRDAILMTESADILFVAAAGNDGVDNDIIAQYPASYDLDSIIAVAATDRNDNAFFSTNYGLASVDLAAPGVSINSTLTGSSYGARTGTSMAAPHVAGAAALLWANNPALSMQQVKLSLLNSVDSVASMDGITLTGGRLNVFNTLSCATGDPKMYLTSPADNSLAIVGENTLFQLSLSDCGDRITGANVSVTPNNGDPVFSLFDDGNAPDETAGDGIYSANWLPGAAGTVQFSIQAANTGGGALNTQRTLTVVDVPIYTVDDQYPYAWADVSNATDLLLSNVDDGDKEIAIGFDFNFYGTVYNSVWVHTNGMLKFGASNELSFFEYLEIPLATAPNNYIATFWEDLNPVVSNGGLYAELQGTAPNRRFVIQWHDLKHFNQVEVNGPQGNVTFQAILYEGSDDIVVQYLDTDFNDPAYDQGARALTGIEFIDGSRGIEYANQVGGLAAQSAILYTPNTNNKKTLTIDETITGGSISDDQAPSQINCPQSCYGIYAENAVVSLTATPQVGFTFTGWSGGGCNGTGSCVVTLDDNKTVSAVFVVTPVIQVSPTSGLTTTEAGGTATFDMSLTTQPSSNVTVALSSDDSSEGTVNPTSVTFTPLNWNQAHTITVTGQNDAVDDGNITYNIVTAAASSTDLDYQGLNPANVNVSNTDNDTAGITVTPLVGLGTTENGAADTFTVKLNSLPTHDVTLSLSSSNTNEGSINKNQLTFTPLNGQTEQTVTVTGVDDQLIDGTIGYVINFDPSVSDDVLYQGVLIADLNISNADNDTPIVNVAPQNGLLTTELGGSDTFEVWLANFPSDDVTITFTSNDTSEANVSPASLTFTPGNGTTKQIITVTGVDDNKDDGDIAFEINSSNVTSNDVNYSGLIVANISGTNQDNDIDTDNDTIIDPLDNCPLIANPTQLDADLDSAGDACDNDDDNDAVLDINDNCPSDHNAAQKDTDQDLLGDACDPDSDNDGVLNDNDINALDPLICIDSDADSCDDCRISNDGFGPLSDINPFNDGPDNDQDGICDVGDDDDDNDGILDSANPPDNCQFVANPRQIDENNNNVGDACEAMMIDKTLCFPIKTQNATVTLICL